MKPISFRVFSNIMCGSTLSQRKQFGAITMARLLTSILVTLEFSSAAKTCNINMVHLINVTFLRFLSIVNKAQYFELFYSMVT